eukprot:Skav213943  [mRNA]  locus=scaffold1979:44240:49123:- [translate_table: standard]
MLAFHHADDHAENPKMCSVDVTGTVAPVMATGVRRGLTPLCLLAVALALHCTAFTGLIDRARWTSILILSCRNCVISVIVSARSQWGEAHRDQEPSPRTLEAIFNGCEVTLDRLGDEDMQGRIRIDEPWG